ncbi:hypothetical protein Ahy_A09g044950 [Arachis hypogaea]|uniref:Uncharacterized protein n=1 Tax=Arachis hypogaea TaxID=3818 RepID=A0A445BL77_ARAHY|nr:hypothetical protein Ahy_A09g044950 [Arachis hypogaea]
MKEKNQNFFSSSNSRMINRLSLLFGRTQGAELSVSISEMLFHSTPPTIQTGGNASKGILIDQCASMQRVIKACMATIIHRWCI